VNIPASFWFWPWFGYMSSLRVLFKWWHGFGWKRVFASWVVMLTFVFVTKDLYVFVYLFGYKMNWWSSFDQLPCRSSHFAVLVEPFVSICRHLCTSCQAIFKECPSCMYIYYRRWGESCLFSLLCKILVYIWWMLKWCGHINKKRRDSHVTLVSLPVKETILFVNCIVNNRLYLFVDHRYTNLGCGMCISRNHCSHW
jgi:hypothetical protein